MPIYSMKASFCIHFYLYLIHNHHEIFITVSSMPLSDNSSAQTHWQPAQTHQRKTALLDFVWRRSRLLGLSQTELAARSGLSRAYLHRLIHGGVTNPGVLTLEQLAAALEVSSTALVRLFVDKSQDHVQSQIRHLSRHDPRDAMVFVGDVTTPDHSMVLPSERFTKVWAVQNVGDVPWPARQLVRLDEAVIIARRDHSGNLTPLLNSHLNSLERVINIPAVYPGQVQELSVNFAAPQTNGTVASIWRLQSMDGQACYSDKALLRAVVTVVGG